MRFAWPASESVLRRFVNAGTVSPDTPHHRPGKRHQHPDGLGAGGGPAGQLAPSLVCRC
jgi:sarcosine oxidase, subunit alpha